MNRRSLLLAFFALPATLTPLRLLAARRSNSDIKAMRERWRSFLPTGFVAPAEIVPLERSEAQWREQLTGQQFDILRQEGTERPFTSTLNDEKRDGVFLCAGCDLPLFTTEMKYDSGTGWPSFFTTIPDAVATKRDFKLIWPRTEYHCARCGGHQGHVFEDGPAPTRQRWCNNGVALTFLPAGS